MSRVQRGRLKAERLRGFYKFGGSLQAEPKRLFRGTEADWLGPAYTSHPTPSFPNISLEGLESHECPFKREERRDGWQTKRGRKERGRKEREDGRAGVCACGCVCVWVAK